MPSAKILVPISGGKDSQAALELAMSNTSERLAAIAKEFETAIPTDAGLVLAAMIREGVTALGSHIGYAVRSLAGPTLDHSPGNMAQPIHDPAVTTPREVLVGESPVDRIAAPAQEQPKSDAQIILDIITLFERRPEFKAAFREEWLRYTGVEQQQVGAVVSDEQVKVALSAACLLDTRESRKDMRAALEAVLALSQHPDEVKRMQPKAHPHD